MRRQWTLAALLVTGCTLTACNDRKLAYGGNIVRSGDQLTGQFVILPNKKGVESNNFGGACLVVAMNDVAGYENMKCTGANRSCEPATDEWYTYCDLPEGAAPTAEGKCWGKPDNRPRGLQDQMDRQYCNRSIDYDPQQAWQPGTITSANRDPLNLNHPILADLKSPSHWRVSACIIPKAGPPGKCQWSDITPIQ